jgi:hypothetical protein
MYESYFKMESLGEQLVGLRFVCRGAVDWLMNGGVAMGQFVNLKPEEQRGKVERFAPLPLMLVPD